MRELRRILSSTESDLSKAHYLNGTFKKLLDKNYFSEILYPGVSLSIKQKLPSNLADLLKWEPVSIQLNDFLPSIVKSTADIFEGVASQGKIRGDVMDMETEHVILPQVCQESLARSLLTVVRNLCKRANNVNAKLYLKHASPNDERASMDQLDDTICTLLESKRFFFQDEHFGIALQKL